MNFLKKLNSVKIFAVIVLIALFYLVPFGAEEVDEPLMLAGAKRFVSGDSFFRDDKTPSQITYLLLTPLYMGAVWFNKGTEGIILTTRYLFAFSLLGIFFLLVASFSKVTALENATLIALLGILSFPRGTAGYPNFNYNSLVTLTLLIMLCLSLSNSHKKTDDILMGFLSGLLFFCNPVTLCASILHFVTYQHNRTNRLKVSGLMFLGALPFIMVFAFTIWGKPWLDTFTGAGGISLERTFIHFTHERNLIFKKTVLEISAIIIPFLFLIYKKKYSLVQLLVLLSGIPFCCLSFPAARFRVDLVLLSWGSLGILSVIIGSSDAMLKRLIFSIGLTSLAATLGLLFFSTGSFHTAVNGLVPLILIFVWRITLSNEPLISGLGRASAVLVILFLISQRLVPYLDIPIWFAKDTIQVGAAKGLRTHSERAAKLTEISQSMARLPNVSGKIMIFDTYSSLFYLESQFRAAGPNLFYCASTDKRCMQSFLKRQNENCYVISPEGPSFYHPTDYDTLYILRGREFSLKESCKIPTLN